MSLGPVLAGPHGPNPGVPLGVAGAISNRGRINHRRAERQNPADAAEQSLDLMLRQELEGTQAPVARQLPAFVK
jgi:hypothetical protein